MINVSPFLIPKFLFNVMSTKIRTQHKINMFMNINLVYLVLISKPMNIKLELCIIFGTTSTIQLKCLNYVLGSMINERNG